MKLDPSERYRADDALSHPWITRLKSEFPLTVGEVKKAYENQTDFMNVIAALYFAKLTNRKYTRIFPGYKELVILL